MAMTEDRMTLADALASRSAFSPIPTYVSRGDYLTFYFSDEHSFSDRIDDVLTIYRSIESKELVGFKIKGVSLLAENVVNIFKISDGPVELRFLLLSALGQSTERQHYYDVSEKCGMVTFRPSDILRNKHPHHAAAA